jgi:hypothetical protein
MTGGATVARKRTRIGVFSASILAAVGACALLSQISPHRPGLSPAPGYVMRNVTPPEGFLAGYVREVQAWLEVTPCEYAILGWADDGALYYEANCRRQLQVWRAHPDDRADAARVAAAPSGLARESVLKQVVLDRVWVPTVLPQSVEPWVREVNLRSLGYPSPDGRWLAFVAERVYGPQDVLLLTEAH